MKYQVRIKDTMSDRPASGLFEDLRDAKAALEEVRKEIRETWATPDEDAAYIAVNWTTPAMVYMRKKNREVSEQLRSEIAVKRRTENARL